jgi:hypothetical protein
MKSLNTIVILSVMSLATLSIAAQIDRGDDLQSLAKDFVPKGMQLVHTVVQGNLVTSPGVSAKKIVLLYGKPYGIGGYEGLVLFPAGFEKFDVYNLPKPESTWSIMEPQAVFFANADSDSANELFITERCMTGIGPDGAKHFYRTRVYDWQTSQFAHMETISEEIGTLSTAAKIRKQLPAIVRRAEARFQPLDVDGLNKKLADNKTAKTPLQIISILIDPFDEMLSRSVSIKADSVEDAESIAVVITDDGYADDSVRGAQYRFKLIKNVDGEWRVSSASKGWRCHRGRGHQDFSPKPCI